MTVSERQERAKAAVRDLIYQACLHLDDGRFADWLSLCTPEFNYRIKTFSPEIRKDMTWMEQDRAGLASMVEMLPKHNSDHGQLTRHVSVYTVDVTPDAQAASAVSSFACYRTMLDGINSHLDAGETQLFLIGKYHDRIRFDADRPLFVERTVILDTRRMDKGTHFPI
jgi:methanesulfonate monooxygenase subunit beta